MINIAKILADQGVVSHHTLQKVNEVQQSTGKPFSELFIEEGIDPSEIVETVTQSMGIPQITSSDDIELDEDLARRIGLKRCYTDHFCPVLYYGTSYVLMYPLDNEVLYGELQDSFGCENFCMAVPSVVNQIIDMWINPLITEENSRDLGGAVIAQDVSVDVDTDNNKTIETLALIMKAAISQRASDILIVGQGDSSEVKFRIDGVYVKYSTMSISGVMAIVNVISDIAGLSVRSPQALRAGKIEITSSTQGFSQSIRFNFIPTKLGGSLNIRLLSDAKVVDYANLGMSKIMQKQLTMLEGISQGLVLVVGPTGSGKSTTMLAYISDIIKHNVNVCTVEDPVEAVIPGANQVDISDAGKGNTDSATALTFTNVLKSFMRHDPDVIMVGEIRDLEVAETALQAADTGHLVISTIHTKDAVSSISRLLGLGVKPYQICDSLVAVVAQRLVRRVCPKCAQSYELPADHPYRTLFNLGDRPLTLKKGVGCAACNQTGYSGRMVIAECMLVSSQLKQAIEMGKPTIELYSIIKDQGFISMIQDGVNKALAGETTLDELAKFAQDKQLEGL